MTDDFTAVILNARELEFNGRKYLTAPVTMIVEGVLSGSAGPIYYSLDELTRTVDAWNSAPILLGHPDDPRLSGSDANVYRKQGLGYLQNPRIINNRLDADAWVDVELAKRIAPKLLADLKAGRPIEVSTGLSLDPLVGNGVWTNRQGQSVPYSRVAQIRRPDHLAILLRQPGACSVQDGCGIGGKAVA